MTFLEYYTTPVTTLKQYLTMTDKEKEIDLAYQFNFLLPRYIKEHKISFKINKDDIEIDEIQKKNPKLIDDFGKWLYQTVMFNSDKYGISQLEIPSFMFLDYWQDIKNTWLVHFTDIDPMEIAKNGFTLGAEDYTHLGLTTYEKKRFSGYNFAFRPEDVIKKKKGKYGNQGVIFTGSGILCYHNGDEEMQVIFNGKDAKNIIPFYYDDGKYKIKNYNTDRTIVENEKLINIIKWVETNYQQYVSSLHRK